MVLIITPRGFVLVLLELFSGLAQELQVNNDIRDELHKPVSLLVLKFLYVLLIVHFEADGGDVIIGYWSVTFFASPPAVVELLYVLEGADHLLVSGLTLDEAQSTFGLQVRALWLRLYSSFSLDLHFLVCWDLGNSSYFRNSRNSGDSVRRSRFLCGGCCDCCLFYFLLRALLAGLTCNRGPLIIQFFDS